MNTSNASNSQSGRKQQPSIMSFFSRKQPATGSSPIKTTSTELREVHNQTSPIKHQSPKPVLNQVPNFSPSKTIRHDSTKDSVKQVSMSPENTMMDVDNEDDDEIHNTLPDEFYNDQVYYDDPIPYEEPEEPTPDVDLTFDDDDMDDTLNTVKKTSKYKAPVVLSDSEDEFNDADMKSSDRQLATMFDDDIPVDNSSVYKTPAPQSKSHVILTDSDDEDIPPPKSLRRSASPLIIDNSFQVQPEENKGKLRSLRRSPSTNAAFNMSPMISTRNINPAVQTFETPVPQSMTKTFKFSLSNLLKDRETSDNRSDIISRALMSSAKKDEMHDRTQQGFRDQLTALSENTKSSDLFIVGYLFEKPKSLYLPRCSTVVVTEANFLGESELEIFSHDPKTIILSDVLMMDQSTHISPALKDWLVEVAIDKNFERISHSALRQYAALDDGYYNRLTDTLKRLLLKAGLNMSKIPSRLPMYDFLKSPKTSNGTDSNSTAISMAVSLFMANIKQQQVDIEDFTDVLRLLALLLCDKSLLSIRSKVQSTIEKVASVNIMPNNRHKFIEQAAVSIKSIFQSDRWSWFYLLNALPQRSQETRMLKSAVALNITLSLIPCQPSTNSIDFTLQSFSALVKMDYFLFAKNVEIDFTQMYFVFSYLLHSLVCLPTDSNATLQNLATHFKFLSSRIMDARGVHPDRTKVKDLLLRMMVIAQGRMAPKKQVPTGISSYFKTAPKKQ